MQRKCFLLFICVLMTHLAVEVFAQSDSTNLENLVRFNNDFRFREGFYLSFEQVRSNRPIPKSRILTSIDHRSNTFFDEVTKLRTITYFDDFGNSQDVETSRLWGYSKNGILYINVQGNFNRITIVGSICHFVATITTFSSRNYNPYYSPYGMSPYGYRYSPYGMSPYGYGSPNQRTTELRQFLLDFNTGKVMEYDTRNVAMLLMHDPELHDEFTSLRSRRQQQLRFNFVRRFNERHPLYFPR